MNIHWRLATGGKGAMLEFRDCNQIVLRMYDDVEVVKTGEEGVIEGCFHELATVRLPGGGMIQVPPCNLRLKGRASQKGVLLQGASDGA